MRSIFILSLSAALLGGCLTSQENPNYEHSTVYKADGVDQNQYAYAEPSAVATADYQEVAPVQIQAVSTEALPAQVIPTQTISAATTTPATGPTDALYGSRDVSGTPGFMAMESARQTEAMEMITQSAPAAEAVQAAPLGAMGTPVTYDYSRNMVATDAAVIGQRMPETVRVMPQATGQSYTVQQGDTVYSLARKTCVGVSVIQSMNGLNADYAIKIGQALTLPTSVC